MSKVLEVYERMALEAVVSAAGPDFEAGERIFDGLLVRKRGGDGGPATWVQSGEVEALCERASVAASERFHLEGVRFKATVMDVAGASMGNLLAVPALAGAPRTSASPALGLVWYVAWEASAAGTAAALGRAQAHRAAYGWRHLVMRDCGPGGLHFAATDNLGALAQRQGSAHPPQEVAVGDEGPVQPFLRVFADTEDAARALQEATERGLRAALRKIFLDQPHVARDARLAASVELDHHAGHPAEPVNCVLAVVATNVAVRGARLAQIIAQEAARQCPELVPGLRTVPVMSILGEPALKRRAISAGADAHTAESLGLVASTHPDTPELFLPERPDHGPLPRHADIEWAQQFHNEGLLEGREEDLEEALLCTLLALPPPELDGGVARRAHVAVAAAIFSRVYVQAHGDGDELREDEAARKGWPKFQTWATQGGTPPRHAADRPEELWREGRELALEWMGGGLAVNGLWQSLPGEGTAMLRNALDHLRESWPQVHHRFVAAVGRQLTGQSLREELPCAARPHRIYVVTAQAGPQAVPDNVLQEALEGTKYVAFSAPAGFGKTCAIKRMLSMLIDGQQPAGSCLVVTTRTSVADNMLGRLNHCDDGQAPLPKFMHYKHDKGAVRSISDIDYLVCELESLGKLSDSQFDVVVLDEFMTILAQTMSPINTGRYRLICDSIRRLCRGARNVIIADALLTKHALDTFKQAVEASPVAHELALLVCKPAPTQTPPKVHIVERTGNLGPDDFAAAFKEQVAECCKAGIPPNIYVFTNVKKLVPDIVKAYTRAVQDGELAGPAPTILVLSGDTMNKGQCRPQEGETLTDWWMRFNCVIATPAVTNSMSFDNPNHFSCSVAFLSNMSCTAPDCFQAMLRVRRPALGIRVAYVAKAMACDKALAVRTFTELDALARTLDNNASKLERLSFTLARRQMIYSFQFFSAYLQASFEANYFSVHMVEAPQSGRKRAVAERDPSCEARDRAMVGANLQDIPRIPALEYDEHVAKIMKPDYVNNFDAGENEADLVEVLGYARVPAEVPLSLRGIRLIDWLCLIAWRHKMEEELLDPHKPIAQGDLEAHQKVFALFVQQNIAQLRGKHVHQDLWYLRKIMRHADLICGVSSGSTECKRLFATMFANSLSSRWDAKWATVSAVLACLGLKSPLPTTQRGIMVERSKLLGSASKLAILHKQAREAWLQQPGSWGSQKQKNNHNPLCNAVAHANEVLKLWTDGAVKIRVRQYGRTRKEGGEETTPYLLVWGSHQDELNHLMKYHPAPC